MEKQMRQLIQISSHFSLQFTKQQNHLQEIIESHRNLEIQNAQLTDMKMIVDSRCKELEDQVEKITLENQDFTDQIRQLIERNDQSKIEIKGLKEDLKFQRSQENEVSKKLCKVENEKMILEIQSRGNSRRPSLKQLPISRERETIYFSSEERREEIDDELYFSANYNELDRALTQIQTIDNDKENNASIVTNRQYSRKSSTLKVEAECEVLQDKIRSQEVTIEDLKQKLRDKGSQMQELEKIIARNLDKISSLEFANSTFQLEMNSLAKQIEDYRREKEDEKIELIYQSQTRRNSLNATKNYAYSGIISPDQYGEQISPQRNNSSLEQTSPLSHYFEESPDSQQLKDSDFQGFTLYSTNDEQYQTSKSSLAYQTCQNKIEDSERQLMDQIQNDQNLDEIQKSAHHSKIKLKDSLRTKREDAEVEFFKMLVLCFKLNHPQMARICHINSERLYRRAKQEGVSFFKFSQWIEREVNNKTIQRMLVNSVSSSFSQIYKNGFLSMRKTKCKEGQSLLEQSSPGKFSRYKEVSENVNEEISTVSKHSLKTKYDHYISKTTINQQPNSIQNSFQTIDSKCFIF